MKRLVLGLLLVFLVSTVYGAETTVTKDTSYVTEWRTPGGGFIYHIAFPCTSVAVEDSFTTWVIDLESYKSVGVSFWTDSGTVWQDCSLKIGYEQSFEPLDSTFATPYSHSTLANPYVDSVVTDRTVQEVFPSMARFIRFYVYPLAGHDITPDGKFHFYIYLSNSPISHIKQGGIGWFTDWRIRSPSHGTLGPKWFHAFVSDNGDTIHFKWEGGGPNRRSIWDNPVYFNDTCRPQSMLHVDGEMSWGDAKTQTLTGSPACTLSLAANDNAVMHRIDCGSATATLSQIVDGHGAAVNEGMYVILRCKNVNDTLVIDHYDGAGKNLFLGHDDTLFGVADRAFFIEDNSDRFTGFVTKRVGTRPSGTHSDYGIFNDSVQTAFLRATDSAVVATLLRCPDITATDSLTTARAIASDSANIGTLLRCPDITATDSLTTARAIVSDSANVGTLLRCPDIVASDSVTTARVIATDSVNVTTLLRVPDLVVADSITTSIIRLDSIHIGTLRMTEGEVSTPDSILAGRFHASDSITVGTLLRCPDITATDSLTSARAILDSLNAGTLVRVPLLIATDSVNTALVRTTGDIFLSGGNDFWITDAGGADSSRFYDDGANTIIRSDNPIALDGTINYAADAQGDDDYEVAIPGITALVEGLTVTFKANTLNTGAATLEITSVGDLDVIAKRNDQVLATGDITAGQIVTVVFDGAKWQMTSQLAQ